MLCLIFTKVLYLVLALAVALTRIVVARFSIGIKLTFIVVIFSDYNQSFSACLWHQHFLVVD